LVDWLLETSSFLSQQSDKELFRILEMIKILLFADSISFQQDWQGWIRAGFRQYKPVAVLSFGEQFGVSGLMPLLKFLLRKR